jgi:hypothetical protein
LEVNSSRVRHGVRFGPSLIELLLAESPEHWKPASHLDDAIEI